MESLAQRLASPAIVYAWSDHLTGKVYCGSHKGTEDDGYKFSSKYLKVEYAKRPSDFTRQIIAKGTWKDCISLEKKVNEQLIKEVGTTYNKQAFPAIVNDVPPMLGKKHTDETRRKISCNNFWAGKPGPMKGKKLSKEHIEEIRASKRGSKLRDETKLKMSLSAKNKPKSKEHCLNISKGRLGKKFGPQSEAHKLATSIAIKAYWLKRKAENA
jgi:hypothetical protein